jgi:radical SAM superfamily enzyme YgiQ (UPF0313 family)
MPLTDGKIIYLGLSSRFIHTMPAGWFLSEYLLSRGIKITEIYRNINENYDELLSGLLEEKPDCLLLSVYIFNVNIINQIISDIRVKLPNTVIIAGGPEADESIKADHIIIGEGEEALYQLLTLGGERIIIGEDISNLDSIPSPYTRERLALSRGKLIYYESSRGCPYRCAYCMAGLTKGVRNFSLERVFRDLREIVSSAVKVIKFTDRTFNADKARAAAILKFIRDNFSSTGIRFHFEVGADLFDEELLTLISGLPAGLVQFEAGVQTLNKESLRTVSRTVNTDKLLANAERILEKGNVHLHLDLIAGLPHDTKESFINSFDKVISLRPHMLQLGFLKMLKYTPLRQSYAAEYGKEAPYEVITTPEMTSEDLQELKTTEKALDKLYNSGRFMTSLDYLFKKKTPYAVLLDLGKEIEANQIFKDENALYKMLAEYSGNTNEIIELLRFDYMRSHRNKPSESLKLPYSADFVKFLKTHKEPNVRYSEFNHLAAYPTGTILRFNYNDTEPVTGLYCYSEI